MAGSLRSRVDRDVEVPSSETCSVQQTVSERTHKWSKFKFGRVLAGLGWVGTSQALTSTARFLVLVVVARALPPQLFGRFVFFASLSLVITNLTELGLGRTVVRFVGESRGKNDVKKAEGFCAAVLKSKVFISVCVLSVGMAGTWFMRPSPDISIIRWALATGLLTSFGPLLAFIFLAQDRFQHYFWAYSIDPLRFAAVLVLVVAGGISVHKLFYVYLLSPAILLLLWPSVGLHLRHIFQPTALLTYTQLWVFGKWLVLITLLESLWQRLDVLMLEALGGGNDVGIYSAAYMFMGVAALVSTSIATVIYPRMAIANGQQNISEVATQYIGATNVTAFLGLPCIFGVTAIAPELVQTILGSSYSAGVALFPWLAIYAIFMVLQMNTGAVLFAIGRPSLNFYWLLFLVLCSVVGNLYFIPHYHAQGAAAVLAITTGLGALFSWAAVALCVRVWPDFKKLGLLFISSIIMYLVVRSVPLPLSGAGGLALRILIGIIVYFVMIKMTCGGAAVVFGELGQPTLEERSS